MQNSIDRYKGVILNPVTVLGSDGKSVTYTEINIKATFTSIAIKFLRVTRNG